MSGAEGARARDELDSATDSEDETHEGKSFTKPEILKGAHLEEYQVRPSHANQQHRQHTFFVPSAMRPHTSRLPHPHPASAT